MATTITTDIASTLSEEDVPSNVCSHGMQGYLLLTHFTLPGGWCCTPNLDRTCLIILIKEKEVGVRVNPKCWGTVGWCEQLLLRQSNDAVCLFVPHMVNIGPHLDELTPNHNSRGRAKKRGLSP